MDAVRAAGGEVYGLTSEPQSLAAEAEAAWQMSIPVIGDPHHDIRNDLADRGWVDIFFNEDYGHLREREWAAHPKGYFQPAIIAIHKTGRILYRWRCVPKYSNMSGAGARPAGDYVWSRMQDALNEIRAGTGEDPPLDKDPAMGAPTLSWFRFLIILTAHGWFIRPKAFPLLRDGDKDAVTPAMAMQRAYWFAGAWLLALIFLPLTWVLGAAVVYLLLLTPGLIEIHRQFQNEPDAY